MQAGKCTSSCHEKDWRSVSLLWMKWSPWKKGKSHHHHGQEVSRIKTKLVWERKRREGRLLLEKVRKKRRGSVMTYVSPEGHHDIINYGRHGLWKAWAMESINYGRHRLWKTSTMERPLSRSLCCTEYSMQFTTNMRLVLSLISDIITGSRV